MPVPQDYTRSLVTRHCYSRCFGPAACDINEEADRRPAIRNINGGCGNVTAYLRPKGCAPASNGHGNTTEGDVYGAGQSDTLGPRYCVAKATGLSDEEKRVMKALLAQGMRNQDIHALINYERPVTINFGRIAGVKKNAKIVPATPAEVAFFRKKKRSFDP